MNLWQYLVKCLTVLQFLSVSYNILDVHVQGHRGSIGEIPQTRFFGKHQLNRTIVFMNLWSINIEILKGDKDFQGILT